VYCDDEVSYSVKEETLFAVVKGIEIEYKGKVAECNVCGEEMFIGEIQDENTRAGNEAYRIATELITVSDIKRLMEMYNIGKKPLAKLLGWGEKTVIRYLEGLTPTREYSDKLESLFDPNIMLAIYKKNESKLTEVAKNKLLKSIKELLGLNENEGEFTYRSVANYFLSKIDVKAGMSVSNLKLQKLVYYAQAWHLARFSQSLFKEDFQAWVHGPVIPELYHTHKNCGYCCIAKMELFNENIFTEKELETLSMIWDVYGKYDAKYLESLTHIEDPWNVARKGIDRYEMSQEIISKEVMRTFYKEKRNEYDIEDLKSLDRYVKSIDIYQ